MATRLGALEALVTAAGFWAGKSVFLTGHTGFKGSWMSLLLARLGARVTGFSDLVPTAPSLFEAASVASELVDIRGDVRDFAGLSRAMRECAPDIVIHMAAQPIVRVGYSDPLQTFATNVMGTANVLQAVRDCPTVRVALVVTTDKCYENREWSWGYREIDALGGHDPYSSSKACAELVTASFRASFFQTAGSTTAIASARAGNVVGGGDFAADRILPDAYRAFTAGVALSVRNPKAVRPWQHVLDPLWGYMLLVEKAWNEPRSVSEAWNFGPGSANEQTVKAVVDGVVARWGQGARWEQASGEHPKETHLLRVDASKARQRLAWEPRLPFEMMLDWTARWYRDFAGGSDPRALTLEQINDYLAAVL